MTEQQIKQTPNGAQNILDKLTDKDKKIKQLELEIKQLETKLNQPLTSQELLRILAKRLAKQEIKQNYTRGLPYLGVWEEKSGERIIEICVSSWQPGRIEYDKEKDSSSKPIKIQGNLRSRTSTDVPYMAFFRPERDCKEHTIEECERTKCQECEIPVVFRIHQKWLCPKHKKFMDGKYYNACPWYCNGNLEWHKPTLKKGDKVILEGEFSNSKDSNRPSFTCYSYQIINSHE